MAESRHSSRPLASIPARPQSRAISTPKPPRQTNNKARGQPTRVTGQPSTRPPRKPDTPIPPRQIKKPDKETLLQLHQSVSSKQRQDKEATRPEIKYFKKYFNLHTHPFSGVIQVDRNLQLLLKLMYRALQNEMSIEEILLNALHRSTATDCDQGDTLLQLNSTGRVQQYRQLDPNFVVNLSLIFDEIKLLGGQGGLDSLKLLSYLTCLANDPVDAKLCIYLFYGDDNTMTSPHCQYQNRTGVKQGGHQSKQIDNMRLMLAILERYSLVTKLDMPTDSDTDIGNDNSDKDSDMEGRLEKNFYLKNYFVQVNSSVYSALRSSGQSLKKDAATYVRLSKLLMTSRTVEFETHFQSLHQGLKYFCWPFKSYFLSIHFATCLTVWFGSHTAAMQLLEDVYTFLIGKLIESDEDQLEEHEEEYLALCKMGLIHMENVKREGEVLTEEWKSPYEEIMDNSSIFCNEDPLYTINRLDYFDWVLNQALIFQENYLIQHFAAELLTLPLVVHECHLDNDRQSQIKRWIKQFCRQRKEQVKKGSSVERKEIFNLLETPLTIIKIGMKVHPSLKIMQMAVDLAKASNSSDIGDFGLDQRSLFLQETLYLMTPSPICIWEQDDTSHAKLLEMRDIWLIYVEQGLDCFIAMLQDLGEIISPDFYLDLHFLDFLETMKASTFFSECVIILLKSTEFISSMRKIFNRIVNSIETGQDGGNIKAVGHIIIFWYSLLVFKDVAKCHKMTSNSISCLIKEMENFHQRLSQEDSAVSIAFNGENHWDSYFREQGKTSERIIEKYLTSPRDYDDEGDEMSGVDELAEKMKVTTRKDWWLASVGFIGKARRLFGRHKTQLREGLDNSPESENENDVDENEQESFDEGSSEENEEEEISHQDQMELMPG